MKKRVLGAIALSLLLGGCNLSLSDVKSLLQDVGVQLKTSDSSGAETQFKESDVKEVYLDGKKTSYRFENGKMILPIKAGEKHEVRVVLVGGNEMKFPINPSTADFKAGRPDFEVPMMQVSDGVYEGNPLKVGDDKGTYVKQSAVRIPLKVEGLGTESLLAVYVGRVKLLKDLYFAENGDLFLHSKTAPTIREVYSRNPAAMIKVVYGTPRGPIAVVFVLKQLPPANSDTNPTPTALPPEAIQREADEFVGDLREYEQKQIGLMDPNQTFNPNPTPAFTPVPMQEAGAVRLPLGAPGMVGAVFVGEFKVPDYARFLRNGDLFLDAKTILTIREIMERKERGVLRIGIKVEGAPGLHRLIVLEFTQAPPASNGTLVSIEPAILKRLKDVIKDLNNPPVALDRALKELPLQ